MDALMNILREIRPDIDFVGNQNLMDGGVLDSFDIVAIVGEISSVFEIRVPVEEIKNENFNSVEAMYKMIQRIQTAS